MDLRIQAYWDEEAAVWVASSEGELGLVAEAESVDELISKVRALVPELIELNGLTSESEHPPYDLVLHENQARPTPA